MNWPQFFKQWGEQAEQLRQVRAQLEAANKKLADLERRQMEAKSLQDQVRGAYKGAVALGALIATLVTIAARLAGLWH